MTVAFDRQYPLSSPGTDGQQIQLEVSRPVGIFSICFSNTPMPAPIPLDPEWDILEMWSTEKCIVGFDAASVTRPDGAGSIISNGYLVEKGESSDRVLLTKPANFLSVIGISNPGELFVSILTRYEVLSIDESLTRG